MRVGSNIVNLDHIHPPEWVPSISIKSFCPFKERCWLNPLENSKSPQPWDRGFYLHCVRLIRSVQSFHLLSRSLKEDESCNSFNRNLLTSPIQSIGKGRTPQVLRLEQATWLRTLAASALSDNGFFSKASSPLVHFSYMMSRIGKISYDRSSRNISDE
jgi:hypothetical protein